MQELNELTKKIKISPKRSQECLFDNHKHSQVETKVPHIKIENKNTYVNNTKSDEEMINIKTFEEIDLKLKDNHDMYMKNIYNNDARKNKVYTLMMICEKVLIFPNKKSPPKILLGYNYCKLAEKKLDDIYNDRKIEINELFNIKNKPKKIEILLNKMLNVVGYKLINFMNKSEKIYMIKSK